MLCAPSSSKSKLCAPKGVGLLYARPDVQGKLSPSIVSFGYDPDGPTRDAETGGLLSHGALLAREYGIPAVMGVPKATTRFATGMRAELDGTRGSVRVETTE